MTDGPDASILLNNMGLGRCCGLYQHLAPDLGGGCQGTTLCAAAFLLAKRKRQKLGA